MEKDILVIGLAVMGKNLAFNLADHGFHVAGYNRTYQVALEIQQKEPHKNLEIFEDLKAAVLSLKKPRKVMLMVKAGNPIDALIEQLIPLLDQGDIIIDGGNSYFQDTIRREAYLKDKGLYYFGVGISGGETGARRGPSIMPGGDKEAYASIQPLLEMIAAKTEDGLSCCTYIGENGAGHFVKMVHNGIEYADMQLIAESYLILKKLGKLSNEEISAIFAKWNEEELDSYLMRISANIMKIKDETNGSFVLDQIKDCVSQKGTGRNSSIEALKLDVDTSMITSACNARINSNLLTQREVASVLYPNEITQFIKNDNLVDQVKYALYSAKIIAYAQGFALLKQAAKVYHWDLTFEKIASIFQAGCIIQARFLKDIIHAYEMNPNLSHLLLDQTFVKQLNLHIKDLRKISIMAFENSIAIPGFSNALTYFDQFHASNVGANLIAAQRDYFGAHTFEKINETGNFHYEWEK